MILTLLTVIGGVGLCGMTWSTLGDEQTKVSQLEKEVRNENDLQAELDETEVKVKKTKEDLVHLESGISDIAYIPTMLIELQKVCEETGVGDLAVRPLPEAPKDPKKKDGPKLWQQLEIEVSGTGDYPSILKLMAAFTSFPKIVGVREVSLVPKTETTPEPTGLVTATIKISAYAFKSKDADKDAKSKGPVDKTKEVNNG